MKYLDEPLKFIPEYFKILTKAQVGGQSFLIPMVLFPAQEHYIQNRTHRDIIVKSRQVGLSSGVLAANFYHLLTHPYQRMVVVAHREDSAEYLLQTVHRFYNNLPDDMKPVADWRSSSRIRFPILDSIIHIDSAQSKTIGRAESLTLVHLSESSQWYEENAQELYAGISQTTTPDGYLCLESTPRGRGGFFYRMYEAAKRGDIPFKPFFYPWWNHPEYKIEKDEPLGILITEEQYLMDNFNLTPAQIRWRRYKIAELGDLFYQEYPENDSDCWLSSDVNVFDGFTIRRYLRNIRTPRWEGNLAIWKRANAGSSYIIGVDVGAGLAKGDFSAACVLDKKYNEHVATLRGRIPPDNFAVELIRLGRQYNDALIAVERAGHGHSVLQLLIQNHYPSIYYYRDYAALPGTQTSQPGWLTSAKTRPMLIDNFSALLKNDELVTYSENLLKEALSFIYISGKPQAAPGQYDDELMALMIASTIRQSEPISTIRAKPFAYVK